MEAVIESHLTSASILFVADKLVGQVAAHAGMHVRTHMHAQYSRRWGYISSYMRAVIPGRQKACQATHRHDLEQDICCSEALSDGANQHTIVTCVSFRFASPVRLHCPRAIPRHRMKTCSNVHTNSGLRRALFQFICAAYQSTSCVL